MSGLRLFNLGDGEVSTDGTLTTMSDMTSVGVCEITGIGSESVTINSGSSIFFNTTTSGTSNMTIASNGNVGIGKTPECILDISGNEGKINLKSTNSAKFSNINLESSVGDQWHISGPRESEDGNLGFYYVPNGGSHENKSTISKDGYMKLVRGLCIQGNGYRLDTDNNRLNFHSNEQFGFYAKASTTPAIGIYENYVSINTSGHIQNIYRLNLAGNAAKTTGTTWISTSDDRIKYNEVLISGPSALAAIKQLHPQTYEKIIEIPPGVSGVWIPTDAEWPSVKDDYKWDNEIGVIAQNVKLIPGLSSAVLGEEVNVEGTQTPLCLNWDYIHNYHIAATKELSFQLEAEKIKVSNLISRIEALENA